MRRKTHLITVLVLGCILSLTFSLQAEEKDKDYELNGYFKFGYRFVDTSGAETRYMQDINLEKGVRLFDFSLHYVPTEELRGLFDRLDVVANNFGGDPYETLHINVQKYGSYSFRYNRRKSTYFYADQIEESPGLLYDLHTFNFDRVADTGTLKIYAGNNVDLFLDFNRYTKKGESTTSFDFDRVEFEFDKPIQEDLKEVSFGVNLHIPNYSFTFEEIIMDYKNSNSLFLPGYADGGEEARYPSSMALFTLTQPYDIQGNTHTFKLHAKPLGNLLLEGSAQINDQDMNLSYSEEAMGVNLLNRPYEYAMGGEGSFKRNFRLYNLDLTYLLLDKLAIIGAIRYHDFNQEGSMKIDGETEPMALGYNTLGIDAGLQYQFSYKLALSGGYRYEKRKYEGTETVDYEEETKRNGFFGNLKFAPSKALNLTLDYQFGSYNNPYTLISPSKFNRFRGTARFNMNDWNISGSYLYTKTKNDILPAEPWESSRNQVTLRVGYDTDKINLFAGYSLIDINHDVNRSVNYPPGWSGPSGSFMWDIMYEGKSNLWDAYFKYDVDGEWKIGAYGNIYDNSGFWEISRKMFKAFVEYVFNNGLMTSVGYRFVDFKEANSGLNDYKANIVELSFGYRWDK